MRRFKAGLSKRARALLGSRKARRLVSGERAWLAVELAAVLLWGVWVTRDYLTPDPLRVPTGGEFGSAIQTHHLWTRLTDCGWCFLWNGSARGGVPAFVDPHGSMLHPIVAVTTLAWGVVNGAKVALVISFALAGVAQWWLAKELGLGRIPRVWSGLMAIVGGHLAMRMELGAFGVVLATSMGGFFFAAVLRLHHWGRGRDIAELAIVLASAILAGQGYIQVGLLGAVPALLFLWIDAELRLTKAWKKFLAAAAIGLLLAAPFVLPFALFSPNFGKDLDPAFGSAQPLKYLPLNLVIDDPDFYTSDSLQKLPFPHLNGLYIGWIPVVLAVIGLTSFGGGLRRERLFLVSVVFIEFLIASATLLRWLLPLWPGVAGVRHPTQIAGLAIPAILGLSAIGLERLLIGVHWPALSLSGAGSGRTALIRLSLKWLLAVPLVLALTEAYRFGHGWLATSELHPQVQVLLRRLQTPSSEWVAPPFGEHFYVEPAVALGLKLSPGVMTWFWEGREWPVARLETARAGPPPGAVEQIGIVDGIPLYLQAAEHYAAVQLPDSQSPCQASSRGGLIEVTCEAESPGRLVVKENNWVGWRAWRDGEPIPLQDDPWLAVEAPPGTHAYVFRYLPWDAPVGMALMALGLALSGWLWFRPAPAVSQANQNLSSLET